MSGRVITLFPSISIVINTFNRAATLQQTLESLRWLKYKGDFEVIVVNGPSTDHTSALLATWQSQIRIGTCAIANLSVSRNIGICMAQGDIVAFIDDDAIPEPEWLSQIADGYDSAEVGGVGGFVFDHTGYSLQYKYCLVNRLGIANISLTKPTLAFSFPNSYQFPHLLGANCSFRRSLLLEINGFDEEYEYFLDETDVCIRIVDRGYLIKQLDKAYVHHKYAPSHLRNTQRVITNYYPIFKNNLYFMLKHARDYHSFSQILEYQKLFVSKNRHVLQAQIGAGFCNETNLAHFDQAADQSLETGLKRGLEGARKYITSEELKQYAGEFKRFIPLSVQPLLSIALIAQTYPTYHYAINLAAQGHIVHVIMESIDNNRVDFEAGIWVHRVTGPWPECAWQEIRRISTHRVLDIVEVIPIYNDLLRNKTILETTYYEIFHRKLNFDKIDTFTAYIQSFKIDKNSETLSRLVDKYAVRAHIENQIGKKYLPQLWGVWDKADQIDYDQLPKQFVLKTNHGCSWNIIVKNSENFDKEAAGKLLNEWMSTNYYDLHLEPQYRNIPRKIFAEEYLVDQKEGELIDYKFFCFYGQPYFLQVDIGRHSEHHSRVYLTVDWRKLPFTTNYPIHEKMPVQPHNFAEMLEIATILSQGHTHVRVDLYNINGRIVFSELTFSHENGFKKFLPDDTYDFLIGEIIQKTKNIEDFTAFHQSKTGVSKTQRKNLVFTCAGDNANLTNWLGDQRNFDLWITYYGAQPNRYSELADYYMPRTGAKFPNLQYVYQHFYSILSQYEAIFLMDDDVIISTDAINRLFEIRKEYDLWILQPAFEPSGKISHPITQVHSECFFRYTNFVENTCPLFERNKLDYFMGIYEPVLVGWGIDWWYLDVLGPDLNKKVAIVDQISCINPHDQTKSEGRREIDQLQPAEQRRQLWLQIKEKYNLKSEDQGFIEYDRILPHEIQQPIN